MNYPSELKYTKDDEWLKVEGDTGVVGITDYAQNALGDIVFVELPKVGAEVIAGKPFGTVESVKAVSPPSTRSWRMPRKRSTRTPTAPG